MMMKAAWVVALIAATAPGVAAAQQPADGVLVVAGEGRAAAAPDIATLRLGVVARAPSAQEAIARMSEGLRPVLSGLAGAGVAPEDVQTGSITLQPVYDERAPENNAPPDIAGYEASSDVTATSRDPAATGALLDVAVAAGANRIGGLQFDLADPEALADTALRRAVADARRRAAAMAAATGRELGAILEIREDGTGAAPPAPIMSLRSADVPIAAGVIEVEARVILRVALEP